MTPRIVANPGSDAAIELGCSCAVIDNARGRGAGLLDGQPLFYITVGCSLHCPTDEHGRPLADAQIEAQHG